LTEEQFFRLTPRQYSALVKRHRQHLDRERTLVASIQAVLINFSMRAPKEAITVDDLLGKPKPELTDEEISAKIAQTLQFIAIKG
jgi:hypothetical protein